MITTVRSTRSLAGVVAAGLLGALAANGAAAAQPTSGVPPVDDAVAAELAKIVGRGAYADDSSVTGCIHDDPQSLAYSTRQVVIREQLTPKQAKKRVKQAINQTGSPGRAVSASVITLPAVPAGAADRQLAEPVPVVVVEVRPDEGEGDEVEIVKVTRWLRAHATVASPNYLLSPSDGSLGVWPNGYPKPSSLVTPVRKGLGGGVQVYVYDVGLAPANQSDRPPNVSELVAGTDTEVVDAEPKAGVVDRYYGAHTVAIADVFATLAPDADVKAVRITGKKGIATDVTATRRMATTLANPAPDPDVIVNSFGSPACDVDPLVTDGEEMQPLGLEAIAEVVDARATSVVVAAAGNRSTDRAFYPGAFDTTADPAADAVIGVGALELDPGADPAVGVWVSLSRSGPIADFSNFGDSIDAWAPGVGLPVRHVDGLRFRKSSDLLHGRALVDGTSYAAPYVGALVAEQMARTGKDAPGAWAEVLAAGNACKAGGTALALVSLAATATTKSELDPEC